MASTDTNTVALNLKPGFSRERTTLTEEGSWYDGDHVRFRKGKPENLRGYEKKNNNTFDGTARELVNWVDNNTTPLLSLATEQKWYIYQDDTYYDITPITTAVDLTGKFNTTAGSSAIQVSLTDHGAVAGDWVEFSSTTTVGGNVAVSGTYVIASAATNTFDVTFVSTADATSVGAGVGTVGFLLNTGNVDAIADAGYGSGVYNAGVSITGARGWNEPTNISDILYKQTQWSMDNWGEDLIGCRRGGNIFYWDRDVSVVPQRAMIVSAAPATNDFIIISPNDRHLISLGCEGFAAPYSPMRVRWADQEDYTNWTPSVTTTAGELDLTDGTLLVGAVRSRNQIHVFSDNALHSLQYVGPPYIFNLRQLGTNCGLIGTHAAIDYDGITYWMSDNNFYRFDGTVRQIPCEVRKYIFERINRTQRDKIYCGINSEFKEIIWLYPSVGNTECDSYVIYNVLEDHWVYGTSKWTTFQDRNVFSNTITTGSDSYLFDNEPEGIIDYDGEPNVSYLESAYADMENGKNIMFVDRFVPDFEITDGNIQLTLTTKMYPQSNEIVKGPYTINADTHKVDLRARGRQYKLRFDSNSPNTLWEYGTPRMNGQIDGHR